MLITPAEAATNGSAAYSAPHVVLRPDAPSQSKLIVHLPGTGGEPDNLLANADPDSSLYASATSRGYRVIGLSYRNTPTVGSLCQQASTADTCFLQTRRTLITGEVQPGSAVTSINPEDAILPRLIKLLVYMRDTSDTSEGAEWGSYFKDPTCTTGCQLDFSKLIFSGHSQGGGHAAVIGREYPVRRVVMLASPCDKVSNGSAASWSQPPLATPAGADHYVGLVVQGDNCQGPAEGHWASSRLNARGTVSTSTSGLCGSDPHACAVKDAQFFTAWQGLWP